MHVVVEAPIDHGGMGVGARVGSYYYAHGEKKSDPNYARPQKISAEQAAAAEAARYAGKQTIRVGSASDGEQTQLGSLSSWNVDDWHWEERDMTAWARSRLQQLLGGISASLGKKGSVAVHDVEIPEGFLAINVRKKKLIPIFELTLCVRWRGEFIDTRYGNTVVDGELRTREFNHDDATAAATEAGVNEPIWDLRKGLTSTVAHAADEQDGMERMDRRMRHQALLDKTFLKKCVPEVQRQLQLFLEEVRVK